MIPGRPGLGIPPGPATAAGPDAGPDAGPAAGPDAGPEAADGPAGPTGPAGLDRSAVHCRVRSFQEAVSVRQNSVYSAI
jgi:hypothetical protein